MEKAMSLINCLDEDGNIDPLKYRELRKFRDACDDEDQVADSDDDQGNNWTGKKRESILRILYNECDMYFVDGSTKHEDETNLESVWFCFLSHHNTRDTTK
jgi:hypothetical protein